MITASNVYFSYTNEKPYMLSGIELQIDNGEYISVVGDNGSGKTTLMRLILKLLKPTSGTIETTATRIGYVPQRGDYKNRDFPLTVGEMLKSYAKIVGANPKTSVPEVLERCGLAGFEKVLTGELSGGESQKARIARALIGSPELLIFDEPSTGIDLASGDTIYALLRSLNHETGITVVSVEHNLKAAMENSSHIYHLSGGHGHICTPLQYASEFLGHKEEMVATDV